MEILTNLIFFCSRKFSKFQRSINPRTEIPRIDSPTNSQSFHSGIKTLEKKHHLQKNFPSPISHAPRFENPLTGIERSCASRDTQPARIRDKSRVGTPPIRRKCLNACETCQGRELARLPLLPPDVRTMKRWGSASRLVDSRNFFIFAIQVILSDFNCTILISYKCIGLYRIWTIQVIFSHRIIQVYKWVVKK